MATKMAAGRCLRSTSNKGVPPNGEAAEPKSGPAELRTPASSARQQQGGGQKPGQQQQDPQRQGDKPGQPHGGQHGQDDK